jgi:hypothetical protein
MNRPTLILGALMLIAFPSAAQFSLEGDFRPRAEFRDGYRTLPREDTRPAGLVSQRSRLILGFARDRITTRLSLQDVRLWGDQDPLSGRGSLDVHEAWVQVSLSPRWLIRAGRQEIRYDNQRFFALNDWNNHGQKHDALLLMHRGEKSELHLGAAFNQSSDRLFFTDYGRNNYKTMNYAWFKTPLSNQWTLSLLGVVDGYEHPGDTGVLNLRATWSAYLAFGSGPDGLRINPAAQHGKTAWGQDISAFYFLVEGSRTLSGRLQVTPGLEWFSGNDDETLSDKFRAFDPLYGAGHTVQGYMDYFTNVVAHAREAGLVNPYLKSRFGLSDNTSLDADLHLFFLQNNKRHPQLGHTLDKYLGTEIDLTLSHRFHPTASFSFGYSVLFASESMEAIKGGSKDKWAHWAYAMLRVRPIFF